MSIILQLSRNLSQRPEVPRVESVHVRGYQGEADIEMWLDIRRRAFARQKLGVRDWNAVEFRREFLDKPWFDPAAMWFAETAGACRQAIGTVTLARRGDGPDAKPVVHWLAVLPAYRRQQVARLLMATLEAHVWDAGRRQIWLETHRDWVEAARLYAALGYLPVNLEG